MMRYPGDDDHVDRVHNSTLLLLLGKSASSLHQQQQRGICFDFVIALMASSVCARLLFFFNRSVGGAAAAADDVGRRRVRNGRNASRRTMCAQGMSKVKRARNKRLGRLLFFISPPPLLPSPLLGEITIGWPAAAAPR